MRKPYWLAALAALLVALATRTLPLWQSPLPFNPDGIHAARLAAAAVRDGHFPLERMATDDLLFPPLLATVGAVLDVAPMRLAQPLSAFVGAVPGLLGVAVVRRVAARRGWPSGETFAAATLAGVLLAVEGLYLHRSMPTDEQTVGLLFVPLAGVVVARAHATGRRAWWAVLAPVLVGIAPLHNLDGMVLALVLTVATALVVAREGTRRGAPLAALTGGFWLYYAGYHLLMQRFTPVEIIQQARLTDVPSLVLAWILLVAFGAVWFYRTRPRTQRLVAGGAFAALFGILALNAAVTLYPGLPSTRPLILAGLLPLSVPVAMAVWAAPDVSRTLPAGVGLSSLLFAPFALIGVSLSASMTAEYLNLAYRVSTFLHFPALVLAALGTVAVGHRLTGSTADRRPRVGSAVRVGLAVAVVVASAASIPIAFGGLSVLNYKGVTTTAEFGATEFATAHANGTWTSDNHLVRIQPPGSGGTEAPAYDWVRGSADPPDCLVLAQSSWTTAGAQFYPAPPERLPRSEYREWVRTSEVVYRSGGGDPIVGVAPAGADC